MKPGNRKTNLFVQKVLNPAKPNALKDEIKVKPSFHLD
ncbi:hypothetical protein AJ85_15390 [Alkalihalobacillus alcalophilus ATCC 27647 = CGMCC 1.3604]|uniref:Uncharacterized protein n=1 Tax=Alkalihalobacillus alcalophilus ATCC 27647 = CGMCC 1.3604 TaxID=1218173 RepID=A0A4S4JWY6_ALKAL|nr:hypothetical protein AJ85_15390 [Alkalihalobacillus alcalophilus ATCC 27647 = CGMCC 1.3604]